MGKLKSYQEQVQETLEKALQAAEDQHRNLAAKPFELAEKIEAEAKELSIKTVRDTHDKALDNMYSALNRWNVRVSEKTAEWVAKFEKEEVKEVKKPSTRRRAPAKKTSKARVRKTDEAAA